MHVIPLRRRWFSEAGGAKGKPQLFITLTRVVQAWKKIEETKKKANDIIGVRQRNAEQNQQKENLRNQREQAERELQLKN